MDDQKRAQEMFGQLTGKVVETMTVWADANQRVLRELVELSTATAKEGVRLCGELQQGALETLRSSQSAAAHWQSAWANGPKDPAQLYQKALEERRSVEEKRAGEKKSIEWGSQIRSYVLHPYQMVKDHRTKEQVGDVDRVLDGDIDVFIKSYLMKRASGTLGQAAPDEDVD